MALLNIYISLNMKDSGNFQKQTRLLSNVKWIFQKYFSFNIKIYMVSRAICGLNIQAMITCGFSV